MKSVFKENASYLEAEKGGGKMGQVLHNPGRGA